MILNATVHSQRIALALFDEKIHVQDTYLIRLEDDIEFFLRNKNTSVL